MKYLHLLFIGAFIVWAACTGNDKKTTPPEQPATGEDTLTEEMPDSLLPAETIDTFSTTAFSSYAKSRSSDFDWTRFRLAHTWEEDSMLSSKYRPDKKFFDAYGRFIKYSPDSTMFIDLDSYNVEIRKDKNGRWTGTEMGPDSEVSLVNLKTGQKTRLLFVGPGSSIEDALWLDQENLAIMGIEDYGDTLGKVAAVWKYNIPTNTYWLYELKDSAAARELMGYWRRERLKGIRMHEGEN